MSMCEHMRDRRVVVAGAGYAGLTASILLDGRVGLTLIDRKGYHEMLTRAHLVAGGIEGVEEDVVPLNQIIKGRHSSVITANVKSINLNERRVSVSVAGRDDECEDVYYDYLILALGSEVNDHGVRGVREHAIPFRSMKDALNINQRLKRIGDGARVAIVGAGATGISLAGALAEGFGRRRRIRITVIDALDDILHGWDGYIVSRVRELLEGDGVEILTGRKVVEVGDGYIVLEDGRLSSDMVIWAAGVRGSSVELVPEVKRVNGGRIAVDAFARVEGYDDAFAVGDISALRVGDGGYAPQLAQSAVRQGYMVARNLLKSMDGMAMSPIAYRKQGEIISIGSRCVGSVYGMRMDGELCRYVEEFIAYNYRRMLQGDGSALLAYEDDPVSAALTFSRALSYVSARYMLSVLSRLYGLYATSMEGSIGSSSKRGGGSSSSMCGFMHSCLEMINRHGR
ncbi:MAG: FAD-dependent oxidoreductase [Candidatus Nitrosocaldus sp.]|nr:FAD-dependent oxidoreductase [Candidatus Nitrosocaldus sp.]MDW8000042.1 FAD-dependent oxidoreductase [Candidatus Nitrosocaldus sp.]